MSHRDRSTAGKCVGTLEAKTWTSPVNAVTRHVRSRLSCIAHSFWGYPPRTGWILASEKRDYMSETLPQVYLARHGNTAWTITGQHTGLTDLPLTPSGECNARRLGERLKGMTFAKVLPARCSAPLEPASWLGLEPWPRSTLTWWNGTTANMKDYARMRFFDNAPAGSCSVTAHREVS